MFSLVSSLDLFSRNETVSEVPTSTLKYFLLPVILGDLNSKLVDNNERAEQLRIVEAYYIDFLQRIKDYDIVEDFKVPKPMVEQEQEEKPVVRGPPGMCIIREHSPLGEGSLYSWSPVLQGCIRLLH